jgi:flagellin
MRITTNVLASDPSRNPDPYDWPASVLEQLSSGSRSDDPTAVVPRPQFGEHLDKPLSGVLQGIKDAQDGIALEQTADDALARINAMLDRIRDLIAETAGAATPDATARAAQTEIVQLRRDIDRVADATSFDDRNLLDGSFGAPDDGGDTDASVDVRITGGTDTTYAALASIDVTDPCRLGRSASLVDAAIASVSALRRRVEVDENRLRCTIANLQVSTENRTAAESRVRDIRMAAEIVTFARDQILLQAGAAVSAQANAAPDKILRLLH